MSDLKKTIFQNILDKKFTKANKDFDGIMKDKVFNAIDDIKKHFVYNPSDASEPETPEIPSSEKKEE